MRISSLHARLTGVLLPALLLLGAGLTGPHPRPSGTPARLRARLTGLSLVFEPNRGQADAAVKFLARGSGYSLFLTPGEAVLALRSPASTVMRMKLVGANPRAKVRGIERLPGKAHYFLGHDPKRWLTGVPTYAKVRYEQVYPGIDLLYYGNRGNQRQLEYDFVVKPGADPGQIRFSFVEAPFTGDHSLNDGYVDSNGDLVIPTAAGEIRQRRPSIYQEVNGVREPVEGGYVVVADAGRTTTPHVSFSVGAYDPRRALVIDPVLVYSSFLGGRGFDAGEAVAVDAVGNAYLAGFTESPDFPTAAPLRGRPAGGGDAFVMKLAADGSAPIYSTYLGGSGPDIAAGLAVDAAGNAYVTGTTESTDFPTAGAVQPRLAGGRDAFVAKISPDGSTLRYSTYLGGGRDEAGADIAVDREGNAYVTGSTASPDFPTTPGAFRQNFAGNFDAFVTKIDAAGSTLVYSTFLGGRNGDSGSGIAVDDQGSAYVAGGTDSASSLDTGDPLGFPATAGSLLTTFQGGDLGDGFAAKLTPDGSGLVYATYLGGSGNDTANDIAVDAAGRAFVAGTTNSDDLLSGTAPVAPLQSAFAGGASDAFLVKLNPAGSSAIFFTYLGGRGRDTGRALAVDPNDSSRVFLVGDTDSADFPTLAPLQRSLAGESDLFIAKIHEQVTSMARLTLDFSTFLGGSGLEHAGGIAVDRFGGAVVTGDTLSPDFPVFRAFRARALRGDTDGFVAKIQDGVPPSGGSMLIPSLIRFGLTHPGKGVVRPLLIRNRSTSSSLSVRVEVPAAPFGLQNQILSVLIPPGGSSSMGMLFTPAAAGRFSGTLLVRSSDPTRSTVNVRLQGRARPATP